MNEHLDPHGEHFTPEEQDIDRALRPLRFSDFMGQPQVLDNLQVFVQAANQREDALDHTLLHGPPGLGKTTLSHILGNELQVGVKVTSGPVLDKPGDLAGLLTNLEPRDVLFIDEIHRLGYALYAIVAMDSRFRGSDNASLLVRRVFFSFDQQLGFLQHSR